MSYANSGDPQWRRESGIAPWLVRLVARPSAIDALQHIYKSIGPTQGPVEFASRALSTMRIDVSSCEESLKRIHRAGPRDLRETAPRELRKYMRADAAAMFHRKRPKPAPTGPALRASGNSAQATAHPAPQDDRRRPSTGSGGAAQRGSRPGIQ